MKQWLFIGLLLPLLAQAQHEENLMQQLNQQLLQSGYYHVPGGPQHYLSRLDTAIRAGHEVADNTYWKGMTYLNQKLFDKALPLLEEACRLDPEHHGYTGWVYLHHIRDYPRALAHYNAHDALTPDLDDREGDHAVSWHRAQLLRYMGRHAEALPGFDKSIDRIEKQNGPEWVSYRYYIARGQSRLVLNRAADALSDFEKAGVNNPKSALANYWKGRALQALGRTDEARVAYNDAILWLKNSSVEQEQYYSDHDTVCEQQVEEALASL